MTGTEWRVSLGAVAMHDPGPRGCGLDKETYGGGGVRMVRFGMCFPRRVTAFVHRLSVAERESIQ